jgi:hypothetical protein
MKLVRWFLVFLCCFSAAVFADGAKKQFKFLSVADIHFDPFSSCNTSSKSCSIVDQLNKTPSTGWLAVFEEYRDQAGEAGYHDTNFPTFKAILKQMKSVSHEEHPTFVIILGDFLRHDYRQTYMKYSHTKTQKSYQSFVKKTFEFIAAEFAKTFPDIDIYPVIGNNDSYLSDYYNGLENQQLYRDIAVMWAPLIKSADNRQNFLKDFQKLGFYKITFTNAPSRELIILNSILFSVRAYGKNLQGLAITQLDWLNQQLLSAKKQHQFIMLAYHIPVGVDIFATIQNKLSTIIEFWKKKYSNRFGEELTKYKVVTAILSGHIHIDTLQAITLKTFAGVPVNITPAVSPVFGNNPGFKIITSNVDTFAIIDSNTYFYSLGQSKHHEKSGEIQPHICA